MSALVEHLEAIQRVCLDATPDEKDLRALGNEERWLIYRSMVRHRLVEVVGNALPRTKKASEALFENTLESWMANGGAHSRYFRDVPRDFADFAISSWASRVEPWIVDLARYEIACWNVKHGPAAHPPLIDFSFESIPVLNPAICVLHLDYPVHENADDGGYDPKATELCIYRTQDHRSATWTLNTLAADLVRAWVGAEQTVANSVQTVAMKREIAIDAAFIEKLSGMLADFIERGIVLGSRA